MSDGEDEAGSEVDTGACGVVDSDVSTQRRESTSSRNGSASA